MGSLKRYEKIAAMWEDKGAYLDLFGRAFVSRDNIDELIKNESPLTENSERSDLRLFIRDFWEAIVDREREIRASA